MTGVWMALVLAGAGATVSDADTQVELTLPDSLGACVMLPAGPLDPRFCQGVSPEGVARAQKSIAGKNSEAHRVWALARVLDGKGVAMAIAGKMANAATMSDATLDDYARGLAEGLGREQGITFRPASFGAHAYRRHDSATAPIAVMELDAQPGGKHAPKYKHILVLITPAKDEVQNLLLMLPERSPDEPALERALVEGVHVPADARVDPAHFGRSRAFLVGRLAGLLVIPLGLLGLLVAGGIVLVMKYTPSKPLR